MDNLLFRLNYLRIVNMLHSVRSDFVVSLFMLNAIANSRNSVLVLLPGHVRGNAEIPCLVSAHQAPST